MEGSGSCGSMRDIRKLGANWRPFQDGVTCVADEEELATEC